MRIFINGIYARSGGEEIEVSFHLADEVGEHECKESFIISAEQYLTIGISKGDSDERTYDEISYAATVWSAVKRGMSVLSYGACSQKALRAKLCAKGIDKEIAAEAAERLVAMGLVRESEDASRAAEKMAARLWGKRRISAALYEKGYSAEAVKDALCYLEDMEIDFAENCRGLIESKYPCAVGDREKEQKMIAALMRYGYSMSEIKDAMSLFREQI